MAKTRKPIPKTQQDIIRETSVSHIPIGGTNNNSTITGIDFNRSEKISLKNSNSKQLSVGLEDIDSAIFYYFNEVIKPHVIQNGEKISVPIIYSSPERWKSFQKDGYYRDKNGGIMLPIIAIYKNLITKDRTVANKLDANSPNLYHSVQSSYNARNSYSNFNILNNRIPVKQYNLTAMPSYLTIEYNCIIQTYYVDQMNKLIEAIEYASDSYWGDPERFKFRAFIDNFTPSVELVAEQKRSAKTTFTIRLRGYILPDTIQKDLNSINRINSKAKIIIDTEIVSNLNENK